MMETTLVDAGWLKARLGDPDLVVLDCSWYLPAMNRDAEAEYAAGHIPGARRFDFDHEFARPDTDLPHMLPRPEDFEAGVRELGIGRNSQMVCYDGAGIFAAPRAWWMFRAMGHPAVAVLDGGMPAWNASGGAVETTPPPPPEASGDFTARQDAARLGDATAVLAALQDAGAVVLDARVPGRFAGHQPEPRAGLRAGHMPGAVNLPFDALLEDGRYRDAAALRAAFAARGVEGGTRVIASCGSGVTASVLALGAEVAGLDAVSVYDGSWSEWGDAQRPDLPVVQDPAP
jgi:thiosulfate/3-mercaptopyruvate sulfurtransferase